MGILAEVDQLRGRFGRVRKQAGMHLDDAARDMDLNYATLQKFANGQQVSTHFRTLLTIEQWCDRIERAQELRSSQTENAPSRRRRGHKGPWQTQ